MEKRTLDNSPCSQLTTIMAIVDGAKKQEMTNLQWFSCTGKERPDVPSSARHVRLETAEVSSLMYRKNVWREHVSIPSKDNG